MEAAFWKEKWDKNEIAFHGNEANPLLVKYFEALALPEGSRIFVPLCGKSLDMVWFLSRGYRAAGAELAETAVRQFFAEQGLAPSVKSEGSLRRFSAEGVDLFCGDIFDLTPEMLGPIDAVYDRAALVALPESMRPRYTEHVRNLSRNAPQLVICYEYDQRQAEGPPFSISRDEIFRHYGGHYQVRALDCVDVAGGLKGKCAAKEHVWHLRK